MGLNFCAHGPELLGLSIVSCETSLTCPGSAHVKYNGLGFGLGLGLGLRLGRTHFSPRLCKPGSQFNNELLVEFGLDLSS